MASRYNVIHQMHQSIMKLATEDIVAEVMNSLHCRAYSFSKEVKDVLPLSMHCILERERVQAVNKKC